MSTKPGRNEPCPCGSGKKFKVCCLLKDTTQVADLSWQRCHDMHLALAEKLTKFSFKRYGTEGLATAWAEFNLLDPEESADDTLAQESDFLDEMTPIFMPWFFYHWGADELPEDEERDDDYVYSIPPAAVFLVENEDRLTTYEKEDLAACLNGTFSLYEVLDVKLGSSIKVKDLFSREVYVVEERLGSRTIKTGYVIFAKIITVTEITMLDGMSPYVLPAIDKLRIIEARDTLHTTSEPIDADWLKEHEFEILELYFDCLEDLLRPVPPILNNTDGDPLELKVLTIELDSLESAFEALHGLCYKSTKEELLEEAKYDKQGKLIKVEFPWLRKNNKQQRQRTGGWDNTVLGHLKLARKKGQMHLYVELNSTKRQNQFMAELQGKMPTGWRLVSVEDQEVKPPGKHLRALPPPPSPEMLSAIRENIERHWEEWPNIPLPALKGKTPLQMAKTASGREAVDALITQFEHDIDRHPVPGQTIELFARLRARLNLKPK